MERGVRRAGRRAGCASCSRTHGVEVVGGVGVERFEQRRRRARRARRARRRARRWRPTSSCCGVGATPDVMLARKSGLEIGDAAACAATRGCAPAPRASTPRATCASTTARCTAGARADRARGGRRGAGPHRRAQHARRGRRARRGAVLLLRPGRLGVARVRRAAAGVGRGGRRRRPGLGRFAVWYLRDGRVGGVLSVGGHGDLERGRDAIASAGSLSRDEILGRMRGQTPEPATCATRAAWCRPRTPGSRPARPAPERC